MRTSFRNAAHTYSIPDPLEDAVKSWPIWASIKNQTGYKPECTLVVNQVHSGLELCF